jgi:hypothetical protein
MATSTTYAHPYIGIQIFDNTEFTEEEVVEERKEFNGMQIGFFAGGRDNQLLYMPNRSEYLRECGNPDFRKFGQAAYNVDNALSSGDCGMYVMNLRPETATYANVVIMVKFKVVETPAETTGTADGEVVVDTPEEPAGPTKKLVYSFYGKTIENAKTEDELYSAALELMQVDPDSEGYYNMPLALVHALGRGDYGNDIHLVFGNVTEYATDDAFYDIIRPTYHTYTLTVAQASSTGLVEREIIYGNFDEEGFDANFEYGPATFFADTINDVENGSQRIHMEAYYATIEAMCALYNTTFAPEELRTPSNFDILNGYTLDGQVDTNLELDTTPENYLNLFSLDGFALSSGSDGWDGMTAEEVTAAKDNLLIKAYSGDLDPMILSRFSSPCNFNMDANYSPAVKRQMAALANRRMYDLMTYLDLGTTTTTSGMISVLTGLKNVYGFNIIKEGHCYKWRDREFTGKICLMTITHWLSGALTKHMSTEDRNLFVPLARDTAVLKSGIDYIPGTFKPVIDPDANDVKNTIYRLRGNCYETLTYKSVQRSTAITSCQTKSDRLLEMNEYILQKAVKTVYEVLASKIYKLGEATDRANYEEDATDIVNAKIGKYVRSTQVSLEMTPADEKKSLLRIKLRMVFKTVIQNGAIEIYLDPRVTDEVVDTTTTVMVEE